MQHRRAFGSCEFLIVIALFSIGLAFAFPILFHPRPKTSPPEQGAVFYGLLSLPALLAVVVERKTRIEWLRVTAQVFLMAFAFPGALALLMAVGKLLSLVNLPL